MDLPRTADLLIIGGGVLGASTAYHLAARGFKRVVLLDREPLFGQGATGRCAGGVRYQFATELNLRLSLASLPMLERFREELGQDVNYRKCGYLFVLTRADDLHVFRANVALQHRLGIGTEWLDGDEVRRRLPQMRLDDALGGTFHSHDGLVDPNSVVMGYIRAASKLGVQALNGVEVTGIRLALNRVQGVETNMGWIETPLVLIAAGPWSAPIGGMAGVPIPIQPVRRQMFTTTPLPEIPQDFPFVIDFARSLYFHREGEGLLIGMSNPHQPPGFDQNIDRAFELATLEAAIARMPLVERAGRAAHWAGLYEVTPDAHPIFGRTPVDGLLILGGFSGHGFMHGPIAGRLMAEFILDGRFSSVDVSMLDLARFGEGRLIREYNVV
jgi:sarcosine oxidase subunit beta